MKKFIGLLVFILVFVIPILALAKIGVGVGTGKIIVDQEIKPGLIYNLPSLVVINTGDELSDYSVLVQHRENQPELKPDKSWFSFKPAQFNLEPGKTQVVEIKLSLPINGVKPGDYFAFLSAQPVQKAVSAGGTTIGVAAAAKLYFTVSPSNIFQGIYYRVVSLWNLYSPWTTIFVVVIILAIIIVMFRRFFNFKISIGKKK